MALKDFKFENLPFTTQAVVLIILSAVLAGVFYVTYLKPMIDQKTALESEVAQLEKSVAQGTAVASQIERFKQELAQLETKLDELRTILPSQKETPQILRGVQEMAAMSQLRIKKFIPQPVVPKQFHSDWPIQLEVEGNYHGLGLFFEKVSQATRIINADNITVRGIERTPDPNKTLHAVCTATTFVFRDEQVAAAKP